MICANDTDPDAIYCGGNVWQAPSYRRGWIVWVGPGDVFILASDPLEHGGMAWSHPDGSSKVLYTLAELKARLVGWTHLGQLADLSSDTLPTRRAG